MNGRRSGFCVSLFDFLDIFCHFLHVFCSQVIIETAPVRADCIGDWTARVEGASFLGKSCGKGVTIIQATTLRNLISGRPDDDRRVVSVAFHKCSEIFFPVSRKEHIVITRLLHDTPCIECLVEHIHTDTVAGFHQGGGRSVVGGTDRIEADFF